MCSGIAVVIVPNALGLFNVIKSNAVFRRVILKIVNRRRDKVFSIDGHWHNIAYTKETLQFLSKKAELETLLVSDLNINDDTFGYLQPQCTSIYRIASKFANALRMDSLLILIAKPMSG